MGLTIQTGRGFNSTWMAVAGIASIERSIWGRSRLRNMPIGEGITDERVAIPDGNMPPAAWYLATRDGNIASRNKISGTGNITSANIGAMLNITAGITANGDISSALINAIVSAKAGLTGTSTITATINGQGNISAALSGQGDVVAALQGLANLIANIQVGGGGLTTSNVAFYVWNAVAAAFNTPGTFGAEVLTESDITKIADIILRRSTANVEGSSEGDALALRSLYGMIAQAVHNTQVSGTTLSVTKSDDSTVLGTRTVTLDPAAQPITGLNSD